MRPLPVLTLACAGILALARPALGQEDRPEDAALIGTALRVDKCTGDDEAIEASARKVRASQLYDRGLVLYEEGNYQGAIDAFVASYCAKPHPASFYNIAQSYERILNFELSITYFERYVAESDPTAPTTRKARLRAEVLGLLPAQLRVATVPEGASITIHNETGLRARGKANQKAPLEVVRGQYTMHVSMPGYKDISRLIETKPGQPYSYYLRLEAQTGTLDVATTPGNARIFLDDRLVGEGNYKATLDVGSYEITAEAPGRRATKEAITIKAGESSEVAIELSPPPKSGRTTLLIASTIGLGATGGTAMSYIFGQGTAATAVGSLASTAVGFGSAYYGIPETTTRGDAWFMIEASLVGLIEGSLLGSYIVCDITEEQRSCTDEEGKVVAAAALGGGLLAAAGSAIFHRKLNLGTADVVVVGSGALWGIAASSLLHAVFDADARIQEPLLLSGLNFGLVAGAGVLATSDLSLERIALIDLGGVGGVLGGALLGKALRRGDEELQHFSLLGMVGGLVGATILTIDMDDSEASGQSQTTSSSSLVPRLTPAMGNSIDVGGNFVPSFGFSVHM